MPTLSNELDEILTAFYKKTLRVDGNTPNARTEAKQAILSKLESIEQEAYKKGYVDGGIEILNASCEVCHAYPMTADCNNANCHAIER